MAIAEDVSCPKDSGKDYSLKGIGVSLREKNLMEKIHLSVAVITKNEEDNLYSGLESVAFANQIVIVDSGSTDRTLEIAAGLGCEIYSEAWQGFGQQKQSAIDKCRESWILVLDADERIPPETAEVIKKIVTGSASEDGFSFPRKNFFQGRWIKHAGWWPDRIIRLFRRNAGHMTSATVHEAVVLNGAAGNLAVPILHYTESRFSKIIQKIDRYSTLGAAEAFREGKTASVYSSFLRAFFTFMQDYFFRLGILDGHAGLTLAVTDSVNKFFKYAKLSEFIRINRSGKS